MECYDESWHTFFISIGYIREVLLKQSLTFFPCYLRTQSDRSRWVELKYLIEYVTCSSSIVVACQMSAKSFHSGFPNLLFEHITCRLHRDDLKRQVITATLSQEMLHKSLTTDDSLESRNNIQYPVKITLILTLTGPVSVLDRFNCKWFYSHLKTLKNKINDHRLRT